VSSTAREASDRGYDVLVVEDGVESIKVEGGLFGVTECCQKVMKAVGSWIQDRDGAA
jgi:nicotinamidase-related amidase